jgi:hypothetical protein
METRLLGLLALAVVSTTPVISWGQTMTFESSTTAVSLVDFDRAAFQAKTGQQVGPRTAMLVNNTDRTILAATVIWSTPNPQTGRPHRYVLQTDTFQTPGMRPILVGKSHTVIGPGTLLSESGTGYHTIGPVPQSTPYSTGDTKVTLDAALFEDGELVGPDTRNMAAAIEARRTAIAMLLAQVRSAGGTRQVLQDFFAAQPKPTSAYQLGIANALRDLVNQGLLLVPAPGHGPPIPPGKRLASVEEWLLALPQLPKVFRTQ